MNCNSVPPNWKGVCINFQCGGPVSRCIYSSPNRPADDHTDRHKITKGTWTTGQTDRRKYYTDTRGFETEACDRMLCAQLQSALMNFYCQFKAVFQTKILIYIYIYILKVLFIVLWLIKLTIGKKC